jgi:processive 1,2-diacylglycerol beta-glucosyltransferase
MPRVIIFHISQFGGHSKAAQNIKEAILYRKDKVAVLNINGMGYFYPFWEKIVNFSYNTIINYFPSLWGKTYDRRGLVKSLRGIRKIINRRAFNKLAHLVKDFHPHCFVATQAFPCGIVADFKQKYSLRLPLVAVVTDYYPHRFWIHPFVDVYVVASKEAKEVLMREGIEEGKIKILGIPISINFSDSYLREKIREEFGFIDNLRTVLIMGGGSGIGPIKKISRHLDRLDCNFQMIVICGKNKKLYDWFKRKRKTFQKPLFPFPYISFVQKIMDFSDIIITKAGGITVSEALSKELAIIIINPIPGQEERNVNYLLRKKTILRAENTRQVGRYVKMLLDDREKLNLLSRRAKEISFDTASLNIADLILELI